MELMKAIAMRKSTRSYKSEQISDEALDTILKAGYAAPVGMGAYKSLHLTVIQNSDLLDKITNVTREAFNNPKMNPLYAAPTLIVVSGQPNEKAPAVELANASCIIENMSLAATDMGLGSVYLLGFTYAISKNEELLKELNLPEGFVLAAGIAIGYPTEPLTTEKELKQTIETTFIK
jgi:nitroreductase